MSRQFQVYLLPSDVETLVDDLKNRIGIQLISPIARKPEMVELKSAVQHRSSLVQNEIATHVDCYLVPRVEPNVVMNYYPNLSTWKVDLEKSDAIEFSGCDHGDKILVVGRFYYQTDMLLNNELVPKRPEFVAWAEQVFRIIKRLLIRSKELEAYVGKDAEIWRRDGGRFVSLLIPGHKLIYAGKQE
jgi:hypothetical protein